MHIRHVQDLKRKDNMDNRITFKQYRNVDLFIFSLITAIGEGIATFATSRWFVGQPMAISITLAMILIAMHRWSGFAAVIAVVGGATFCLASSASPEQFLIYCGGNVFALVSLVFFKLLTKSRVRESFLLILAYSSAAYLAMALGRWILSLPFDAGFTELVGFLVSDVLSLLFAVLILWSCRSVDGLIEDQKAYLFRLERERQKEAYGDEE
jgi:hypothetical protein